MACSAVTFTVVILCDVKNKLTAFKLKMSNELNHHNSFFCSYIKNPNSIFSSLSLLRNFHVILFNFIVKGKDRNRNFDESLWFKVILTSFFVFPFVFIEKIKTKTN